MRALARITITSCVFFYLKNDLILEIIWRTNYKRILIFLKEAESENLKKKKKKLNDDENEATTSVLHFYLLPVR